MVQFTGNRRVTLAFFCNENTFINDVSLAVPDDGLIVYTYRPSGDGCSTYRMQVSDRLVLNSAQTFACPCGRYRQI